MAISWLEKGELLSTGNTEIDKKMGGGIPMSTLTLIEGPSDSGKSVLTQQMIWGSVSAKTKIMLFTTENSMKSLVKQMQSLNLDASIQINLGWIRIYPIQAAKTELSAQQVYQGMLKSIARLPECELVIIDSITNFITYSKAEESVAFFEECKDLCNNGKTMIVTAHTYAFHENTLSRVRSMCDAHLQLRTEQVGDKLVKILEVAKVRGAEKDTGNIISFEVEPNVGMRIIPVSKAKA